MIELNNYTLGLHDKYISDIKPPVLQMTQSKKRSYDEKITLDASSSDADEFRPVPKKKSFFISDILGLETPSRQDDKVPPNKIAKHDAHRKPCKTEKTESIKQITDNQAKTQLPAWVFCTRYSDRPSAGPRQKRKTNNKSSAKYSSSSTTTSTSSLSSQSSATQHGPKASAYEADDDVDELDDNESLKSSNDDSKRPRTAFTSSQLNRLKDEFDKCKYLTGDKRQYLATELNLNESQIKIWFQNKRAKIKKSTGTKNVLALKLMAQGLYNHCSNRK